MITALSLERFLVKAGSTDARVGVEVSTAVLTRLGGGLEQESSSEITRLAVLAELRGAAGIEEEQDVIEEGVGVKELDVGVEAVRTLPHSTQNLASGENRWPHSEQNFGNIKEGLV